MKLLDDRIAVVEFDPFKEAEEAAAKEAAAKGQKKIIIPEDAKKNMDAAKGPKFVYGKVQLTGAGKRLDNGSVREMGVAEGDVVAYYGQAGFLVRDGDGTEVRIITEADVIAIL